MMDKYIDGFVFPIPRKYIAEYKQVAEKVADIWKEYGALEYKEFVGDDLHLQGTKSFLESVDAQEDEVVIFGFVTFSNKKKRDYANKMVPKDSRMAALVAPITDPDKLIFDASRMVYGGFMSLIS